MKNVVILLFFAFLNANAQENTVETVQNQANQQKQVVNLNYNDKPLYVDGEFEETDSELNYINNELKKQKRNIYLNKEKAKKYGKLKNSTEKLVDATEEYVDERKDSEKLIKEYNEKISCLLEQNSLNPKCDKYSKNKNRIEDKVIIKEAAPVVQQEILVAEPIVETKENVSFNDKFKVLLGVGSKTYMGGRNFDTFESNAVLSLSAESEVWNRVAVGLTVDYNSLDFLDTAQYRPVTSKSLGVELYGKFYLLNNSRFRPFVGAGVGLNRINLEFQDSFGDNPYYAESYYSVDGDFRNSYTANNLQANIRLGAEVAFTRNIGIFAHVGYLRSLSSFGKDNFRDQAYYLVRDREVLELLHSNILDAQSFGATAGAVISF